MVRAMKAAKSRTRTSKSARSAKAPVKPTRPSTARRAVARTRSSAQAPDDLALFDPLSEGERADALRILTEDRRLAQIAKIGRYRVIAAEPLVVKQPHVLWGRRAARVVLYDFASDRCVEAAVDLDGAAVVQLAIGASQPMLSREEEAAAVAIALADDRVKRELALGDQALAAMHYWNRRPSSIGYGRRCAAVLLGPAGATPSWVAVVDLVAAEVVELVAAASW
jgi:hypothetical protein